MDIETLPAPVSESSSFHVKPPEWEKVDKLRFTFFQTAYTIVETAILHPLTVAQTVAELDKVKVNEKLSWSQKASESFKNNLSVAQSFRRINPSGTFYGAMSAGFTAYPITVGYYQLYDMIAFLPYMKVKEEIPKLLGPEYSAVAPLLAGMTTAIPICLIGTPMGVMSRYQIKLRLENKPWDIISAFKTVVHGPSLCADDPPGLRRLYRGLIGSAAAIPLMGCSWMFYETTHAKLIEVTKSTHLLNSFVAGAWAGAVTAALWRPVGVVVARKQVAGSEGMGMSSSYFGICRELLKEEGFGAFFKGLQARILSSAPRNGVFYSCYAIFSTWAMGGSVHD